MGRLNYIAYQEQHRAGAGRRRAFLARLADGGLRDAVSLLDQCASAATGAVTVERGLPASLGLAGGAADGRD